MNVDKRQQHPYNWDLVRPRGGIGIRGRLRACAHPGVSVRVGAGAPRASVEKADAFFVDLNTAVYPGFSAINTPSQSSNVVCSAAPCGFKKSRACPALCHNIRDKRS